MTMAECQPLRELISNFDEDMASSYNSIPEFVGRFTDVINCPKDDKSREKVYDLVKRAALELLGMWETISVGTENPQDPKPRDQFNSHTINELAELILQNIANTMHAIEQRLTTGKQELLSLYNDCVRESGLREPTATKLERKTRSLKIYRAFAVQLGTVCSILISDIESACGNPLSQTKTNPAY